MEFNITSILNQFFIIVISYNIFSALSLFKLPNKEQLCAVSYVPALLIISFLPVLHTDVNYYDILPIAITLTIILKIIIILFKKDIIVKNFVFINIVIGVLILINPVYNMLFQQVAGNIIYTSISIIFIIGYFVLNSKNKNIKNSYKIFLPLIAIIISSTLQFHNLIFLSYILLYIFIYLEIKTNKLLSILYINNYESKFKKIETDFHFEVQKAAKTRTFHVERIKDHMAEVNKLDHLTKALTRKAIVNAIDLLTMSKNTEKFVFLMFDIDKFKHVNDTYGHIQGDVCLKLVATIAKQNLREIDFLGRYGGDEFIIVLPNQDLKTGLLVANRFREKVSETTNPNFTISVGASIYPWDGKTFKELLDVADKGLYLSKEHGRNSVNYDGYVNLKNLEPKNSKTK
ncbi:GGDEF domain-containing protein [Helicovermis profundi]|uniref:GGDEF domain-containing protein n=1 Tax=Helicovermis profundi TaxID=3065157 RepID=A0AAU9E4L3_9FIRM|nr:hypothetical protein HLPR_12660 [Clostridia bacterium S502]